MVFVEVILPVILIFLSGYILQKRFKLDIKSVSTVALYLLVPMLVFRTFYNATLDATYLYILIYGLSLTLLLALLIRVISYVFGYDSTTNSSLVLSTAFMNNGNFGSPVILFAFGEEAFSYAVAIMVLHLVYMSSLGVFFAARGRFSARNALISVLKMPMVHAAVLAITFNLTSIPALPENLYGAIDLLANAAIPTVMVVLGMQLAEITLKQVVWSRVSLALIIRLLASPLIALVITYFLPVSPLLATVMVVQAAMPTAVITTMYALEYDCHPDFVSSVTLVSTLLSIVTLSILLSLM